jgi:hypothetical protein
MCGLAPGRQPSPEVRKAPWDFRKVSKSALIRSFSVVADAVRPALIFDEFGLFDELHGGTGRSTERDDLIVVAMDDERRHIDRLQTIGRYSSSS